MAHARRLGYPDLFVDDPEPPPCCSTAATPTSWSDRGWPSSAPRAAPATATTSPSSWGAIWPRPASRVVSGLALGIDGAAHARRARRRRRRAARSPSSAAGSTSSTRGATARCGGGWPRRGLRAERGPAGHAAASRGGSRPATASSPRWPTSWSWSSRTARAGALLTVDEALERRGRTVMAVPGPVRSPASRGHQPAAGRRLATPWPATPTDVLVALGLSPGVAAAADRAPARVPTRRTTGACSTPSAGSRPRSTSSLLRTGGSIPDARLGARAHSSTTGGSPPAAAGTSGWPSPRCGMSTGTGRAPWVGPIRGGRERSSRSLTAVASTTVAAYGRDVAAFVAWAERLGSTGPGRSTVAAAAPLPRLPRHPALRQAHRRPQGVGAAPLLRLAARARARIAADPSAGLSAPGGRRPAARVLRDDELARAARRARRARVDDDRPRRPAPRRRRARAALRQRPAGRRAAAACGRDDLDLAGAASPCWARAPRSGGSRSASRRSRPSRGWLGRGPGRAGHARARRPTRCSSTGGAGALTPRDVRRILDRRAGGPDPPPRPAPHLRHPPARRRCRPAGGAGAARPRRPGDDPDLHSRHPGAAAARLRSAPTPGPRSASWTTTTAAHIDELWADYKADGDRDAARAADPALLAAGEVRRRPRRRRSAAEHRAVRPRQLRHLRADRRHRQVRSRPRATSSRPTPSPASRAPSSTSCARSTGCRVRCGPRPGRSSGRTPSSRTSCTARPTTTRSPPSSA